MNKAMMYWLSGCLHLLALTSWNSGPALGQDATTDHSIRAATSALQVRDGFTVDAIAHEPLVVDPVAIRFDYHGRLWVVEMPDYPTGPRDGASPSGRIKILSDSDGDGKMDTATVFADGLLFATGVQPYRNGAFVTLAGRIEFMTDRDADSVADETEVLFRGFATDNEQLRANHPTLGPDGMIYIAGGLRGGKIMAVSDRYDTRPDPVDLRDRDFCFDPEGGSWFAVAGKSQHGQTVDDFGRRIGCSNRNPAIVAPLTLAAIERDPMLVPRDALHDIGTPAENSVVKPIAKAWTTSNLHDGQFSAACGVCAPGWRDAQSREWFVVCEPTSYLVQRQFIKQDASVWTSHRELEEAEFLASADPWFRPVDAVAGPGDGVFIVDMARAVIEHPDWVPAELKTRGDTWMGTDLGRVWRIRSSDQSPLISRIESDADALHWLSSSNPWQREMATQYLLEHGIADLQASLRDRIAKSESAAEVARIAQLLQRFDVLTDMDVNLLIRSKSSLVRSVAVSLSQTRSGVLDDAFALSNDSDPLVRRQVAALAVAAEGVSDELRLQTLQQIIDQGNIDRWTILTIASADDAFVPSLAGMVCTSSVHVPDLVKHLVQRLACLDPAKAAEKIVTLKQVHGQSDPSISIDAMAAWIRGVKRRRAGIQQTLTLLPPSTRSKFIKIGETATRIALSGDAPPQTRVVSLTIVDDLGKATEVFRDLVAGDQPPSVREAALAVVMNADREWTRQYLLENIASMTAGLRSVAVRTATSSADNARWLLSAVSEGAISKQFVDPATAKRLRKHPDKEISQLADELFRPNSDRAAVIAKYRRSASHLGDPASGQQLFIEHCSACHQIDGRGTNVGPDISDSRSKTPEALLAAILDPNAAIDASFVQYTALLTDGQVVDGLLIGETAKSVTLAKKGGTQVTIDREEIERFQTPGISLMPEGFEQNINVDAMADLIAYLKSWRYLKTEIPGAIESLRSPSP
ncbi:MAG: c-type cytochrome [Pirellulaceae bacterium]|nr:c-type cytochrome [Pirellulaceae bacterium]